MNERKRDHPYEYPNSFMQFLASTIHKRFLKMDFTPPALNSEEIAVDSSGIKVHNRGEWVREKYKRRRGG